MKQPRQLQFSAYLIALNVVFTLAINWNDFFFIAGVATALVTFLFAVATGIR